MQCASSSFINEGTPYNVRNLSVAIIMKYVPALGLQGLNNICLGHRDVAGRVRMLYGTSGEDKSFGKRSERLK